MYLEHFGLREFPFAITPDTEFAYRAREYQAAMNVLRLALDSGEGFVKVTGEVGTGKTLLCRQLLASLPAGVVSAYVLNPRLSPCGLLRAIGDELGLPRRRGLDEHALYGVVEAELLRLTAQGQRVVLCIDEAQALSLDCLEALRLLSNLETGKRKLLQIVLFGQPELDARLAAGRIRSLASRIGFAARLEGLDLDDFHRYLRHRLQVAGWHGPLVFGRGARWLLWRASRGVPRRANILAHKTLMLAYGEGRHTVGWRQAWAALRDDTQARSTGASLVRRAVAALHPHRTALEGARSGASSTTCWPRWTRAAPRPRPARRPWPPRAARRTRAACRSSSCSVPPRYRQPPAATGPP
jgi:MSHA biogenesis protein MshM